MPCQDPFLTTENTVEKHRQIPPFTNYRAFWTAFNNDATPGFSVCEDEELLADIYDALAKNDSAPWALAEGSTLP